MKKKYRTIIVDGKQYGWATTPIEDECGIPGVRTKIWDGKNSVIFEKESDQQAVSPSMVEKKIRALAAGHA